MEQEQKEAQSEERESQNGEREAESDEQAKAQEVEEEHEKAKEKVAELEENPPEKLEDWPDDKAKYETFGGPEGEHSYEDGPEAKLGPSSLRHRDDGSVEIAGEEADNPEEYKGDPIPGGPTDPDSARMYGEPDLSEEGESNREESDDSDESDDSKESDDSDD